MRRPVRPLDRHSPLFAEVDRMLREQIAPGVNTALYRLLGLGVLQNNNAGRRATRS